MKSRIRFVQLPRSVRTRRATDVYDVVAAGDDSIGTIKWHSHWRQYCFFPHEHTVWSRDCLIDVFWFVHKLMNDRKRGAKR